MTVPSTTAPAAGPCTTRLAPSPTGALHLGNARTFLVNWAMARRLGWRIAMRIEDLDGPRVKNGADTQAIEDLRWLGIDWDDPPVGRRPLYQRDDLSPYHDALRRLAGRGLVYPCTCTRSEILAAQSAPHGDEHEVRYPGTCAHRAGTPFDPHEPTEQAWRLRVPDEDVAVPDAFAGEHSFNVQRQVGDFVVSTKAGVPAYQLAVVVDDARQGVTDIVRGDDLLRSAARQLLLYRVLGLLPVPRYYHLPLVLGPDGRRLAKRHGDTRVAWYREQGVDPRRIVGLIAHWSGVTGERRDMSADEFAQRFTLEKLPRTPVTFGAVDHAWLTQRSPA